MGYDVRAWTISVTSAARRRCAVRFSGFTLCASMTRVISAHERRVNSLRYFSTSASSTLIKYWMERLVGLCRECGGTDLVKVEHTGHAGVKPDGIACALSKLVARGGGEERSGDAECDGGRVGCGGGAGRVETGDELEAGEDVAPLVGAADLDGARAVLVEVVEVVRLQQLVRELGEREALVRGQPGTDTGTRVRGGRGLGLRLTSRD